jgi:hypothetical protein
MVRECACLLLVSAAGCSFVLDFSDHAIPRDAQADAPYTQAECDYQEPNDTIATAAPVTAADTGPAAICAGALEDHDFYRFTVPAMTARVEIRISTMYRDGGDLDLRLYRQGSPTPIARSTGFADDEVITCPSAPLMCPVLSAGDYVFEVYPARPGSVNRYTFSIALTAM